MESIILCSSTDSSICQSDAVVVPSAAYWEFAFFCRLSDNGGFYSTSELMWTGGGCQSGSIMVNVPECLQTHCVFDCVPQRFDIFVFSLVADNKPFMSPYVYQQLRYN